MEGSVMTYNSETGELVCFSPPGEEVLRVIEPDFKKAHSISEAIQKSYNKGSLLGRLRMQGSIERHMDDLNHE